MGCITGLYIRSSAGQNLYRPFSRGPRLRRGSHAPAAHEGRCGHSESLSRHCCRQQSPGHSAGAVASEATAPAVSTERGVDFVLPPQSDHQSESLLYSFFLGRVSRGLLGFSHEDIIDFDIRAHGPHSVSCVSGDDIIHIGAEQAPGGSMATVHEIKYAIAKAQREPAGREGTE